ncbi:MAG: hypothetical protein WCJ19_02455 [bacterium]
MDQALISNFKKTIADSSSILIVLPEAINTDTIAAASTFFHFVTTSLRKNALIACSSRIPVRFSHILGAYGIEEKQIVSEIKPLQYFITIKNTEKDLDIAVNRKEGEIEIVMMPKINEIDFSKISLNTVGTKFDLFVVFNAKTLEDLGSIYNSSKNVFEKIKTVSITSNSAVNYISDSLFDNRHSTASETVYSIITGFGATLDQTAKDVLFEGIVEGTDGLHKTVSKNSVQTTLDLTSDQVFSDKFKDLFYGYSPEGLNLRKKIFSNIVQKNNIVYSILSSSDLEELHIEGYQLEGMDYLPFGIVDQVDTYILAYDLNGNKRIIIEAENSDELYSKLKGQFKTTRSSTLITITTESGIDSVLNAITGQTEIFNETQPVVKKMERKDNFEPMTINNEPIIPPAPETETPFEKATEKNKVNENSGPFQPASI